MKSFQNITMSLKCLPNLCSALSVTPNDILMGEYGLTEAAANSMLHGITKDLTEYDNRLLLGVAENMRKFKKAANRNQQFNTLH